MKVEFRLLCTVLVFLVTSNSASVVRGQDSPVQFTCVTWETLSSKELFYIAADVDRAKVESEDADDSDEAESDEAVEANYQPIKIGKRVRSEVQYLKGNEKFALFIRSELNGEIVYQVVGEAPVISNRMLFLIEKNQQPGGLPLKIFAMDDSEKSFPVGNFRFLNFTTEPVSVDFGGSLKKIEPGRYSTVPSDASKLGGFQPFFVRDMNEKTIAETRLFGQPRQRKIAIFLPPSRPKGRLKLRFLTETIPLVPQVETPGKPQPVSG